MRRKTFVKLWKPSRIGNNYCAYFKYAKEEYKRYDKMRRGL